MDSSFYFQFVPFRDFYQRHGSQNMNICKSALAKEVLAEVPDQFISYMKTNNIQPRHPSTAPPAYSR